MTKKMLTTKSEIQFKAFGYKRISNTLHKIIHNPRENTFEKRALRPYRGLFGSILTKK